MQVVLDVALPVFALIVTGWIAGRTGLLGQTASVALNQFVYWFALPAVLFLSMARQPLHDIFNLSFIGAFLGAMLLTYVLGGLTGFLIKRENPAVHAMQALTASFSNTGYMGIPLFIAAFGAQRLLPAVIATVIMSVVMVGIAVIALELAAHAGHGLGPALARVGRALVRNPLIVSSLAGLAWNLAGLSLPQPVVNFCQLLGAAAGPGALFAIGIFLAGRPLRFDWHEVGWVSALKLVIQPLITWGLIVGVFHLDRFWTGAALLLSALPTGGLTFVLAQQYGIYVDRTSQSILMSTLLSVPILSWLLMVYAG